MNDDARPRGRAFGFRGCYRGVVGAGLTGRAAIALLTTAAAAGCLSSPGDGDPDAAPLQLLANPSFEEGGAGWIFEGSVELDAPEALGLPPASDGGQNVARLGFGDNQTDRISQEVLVPASADRLVLSGTRCYITAEGSDMVFDSLTITIEPVDGGAADPIITDSNQTATYEGCQWLPFEKASQDALAGQRIMLVIEAVTDDAVLTSFAFDDLALTASP